MTRQAGAKRRPAARPARRTVTATIEDGDFAGWSATAYADFPAGLLADLQSGDVGRIIGVLDRIVTEHNFPNDAGELAERMADVDPYQGLLAVAGELFDRLGKLPNR